MQVNSAVPSAADGAKNTTNIAGNSSADEMSTMFLELLVAQISNQNPLQPMDGTQYVSQLAEFSNVESLQSIRQNTADGLDYVSSLAVLEATNMVGQTVDVQASSIALEQDGSVSGMVNLGEPADSVTVQLYNQDGELVEEKQLPYSGVGSLRFEFENQEAGAYAVRAYATTEEVPKQLDTWLSGEVERVSVGKSLEDILLQVDGLGNFGITEINQVA
ncbi:flagellar basal-body rod modification protein FlgD [Pseudoalteromonas undina]|jgi:flagellar basal-body rod modification protein FlgD|uniref:Basal-body rod modification protein FlgD n=1 Tax=Pseudoalteromonas undina TaxID=43660 RepID=A0ABN0NKH2_9GAMM|nr:MULTISPECIES: flagellar hook capping FlgD N-terminal domain-containing protein [Pseudoalteromonas]KAF7767044.1 flagellar basal-body rod modification protein FlgD [Pseudoalteromonas undina]OLF72817.1 LfgD [Pseudoalteromonas haloplanktis]PWS53965.1 LfgD [Pseudoalteromonas sp. meg-B1]